MKVNEIKKSNGLYKEKQRNNIKYFLNISKYDLVPSIATGTIASALLTTTYSASGTLDAMIFGGVSGAALILAINGIITGIKATKEKKEQIKKQIETNNRTEIKGRKI